MIKDLLVILAIAVLVVCIGCKDKKGQESLPAQDSRPGGTPAAQWMTPAEIERTVIRIVAQQTGVRDSEIRPTTRLVEDLRTDDLDLVELTMSFEDEFWISIPDEEAEKIKTVDDAAQTPRRDSPWNFAACSQDQGRRLTIY